MLEVRCWMLEREAAGVRGAPRRGWGEMGVTTKSARWIDETDRSEDLSLPARGDGEPACESDRPLID